MIDLVPDMSKVKVRRTWRGLYANTQDGNPHVGFDDTYSGLFHAVGMGGQGFMLGCGLGRLISRTLMDKKRADGFDDVALKEFDPFRQFPEGEELLR